MKRFFVLLLLIISAFGLKAQIIDGKFYTRSNSYTRITGIGGDSVLFAPRVKATNGKSDGSIYYNRVLKTLELYDSTSNTWYPLSPLLVTNGIINGGTVSWTGTGLNFYISAANYVIGGVLYHSNDTTITLPTADPTNPRIDLLVLNSAGVDTLIGTPAANPAQPQITPGTELELTSVLINAGATTPSGITQTIIWDENTESTVASSLTVNANNTNNPFHLTKAIDITSHLAGGGISFTLPSTVDLTNQSVLVFYLRLKGTYSNDTKINISFTKEVTEIFMGTPFTTNEPVSNNLTFGSGEYGYSRTTVNAYQTIQIPISAFTFISSPGTIKKMDITLTGAGGGAYIDYIQVQSGVPTFTGGVTSFNARTGNVLPEKADYSQWFLDSTYRINDSIFGIRNGTSYFQFKDSTGGGGADSSIFATQYRLDTTRTRIDVDLNGKQPTLVSGTNIKTVNGNSLLGSDDLVISGGGGDSSWINTETGSAYTTLGTIANTTFPGSALPTAWNDVTFTATVIVSGNKIAISGGARDTSAVSGGGLTSGSAYSNRIEVDSFYNYDKMRYRFTFVPQTKNSVSQLAFSFLPNSLFFTSCTAFNFDLSDDADSSGMVVIRQFGTGTVYAVSQKLSFSVGDSLEVQIIRNGWTIELVYKNITTGNVVRTSYTGSTAFGTGGKAYFGAIGGSQDITHFAVDVYNRSNYGITFMGDSQFSFAGATSEDKGIFNQMFGGNSSRYANLSNGGATLNQMRNSHVPNAIRLNSPIVVIGAGFNDRRDLATDTNSFRQRLDSIIQPIRRNGQEVVLATMVPSSNMTHANLVNFTTVITNLATTYGLRIIRIDSLLYISSSNALPRQNMLYSDAVHWSDSAQYLAAQQFKLQLPELDNYFKADTTSPITFYDVPTGNAQMEHLVVSNNKVYKFQPQPFNGIPNSWNSNGAETYAQANTAFHISGVARTDSAVVSNSYTGGLIGFNKSTLSNFNITNAGTPGSNANQIYDLFDNVNSTRNFVVGLYTDKANGRNTVRSTRNTLINNNQITITGGSGNNFGANSNRIVLSTGAYNIWAGTDALHSVTTGSYNIDFTSSIDYNGGTPSLGNTDGRIAIGTFYDYTGSEVFANGEVVISGRTRGARIYNFGAKGGIATSVVWRPGFQAGTNVAGVPLYIEEMPGTGSAAGGGIIFATMTPGASGTTKSTTRNSEISISRDIVTVDAVLKNTFAVESKYTATATGITLDNTHQVVNVTATGQTITLPTAVGNSRVYTIKLTASGTGTVATTSSQTIDGSTTYSLVAQYKYVVLQSDGSNWIVIGNN